MARVDSILRATNLGEDHTRQPLGAVISVGSLERVPLLVDYERWFLAVALLPSLEPARFEQGCIWCQYAVRNVSCGRTFCDCQRGYDSRSPLSHVFISQSMMRVAAASVKEVSGVLFLHFDMWLNVRLLPALLHDDALLTLQGGLRGVRRHWRTPVCVRTDRSTWEPNGLIRSHMVTRGLVWEHADFLGSQHGQFANTIPLHVVNRSMRCGDPILFPDLRAATHPSPSKASLHATLGVQTGLNHRHYRCCWGWVDLFYVPARVLSAFVLLCTHVLHAVHHEVAIPTAADILSLHSNIRWVTQSCHGDCCTKRWALLQDWPNGSSFCGHRLDLRKERHRMLLQRTLHPHCDFAGSRSMQALSAPCVNMSLLST